MSMIYPTDDSITLEGRLYEPPLAVPGSRCFYHFDNIQMLLGRLLPGDPARVSEIYADFHAKLRKIEKTLHINYQIHNFVGTYYPHSCAVTMVINKGLRGELPVELFHSWKREPSTERTPLLSVRDSE